MDTDSPSVPWCPDVADRCGQPGHSRRAGCPRGIAEARHPLPHAGPDARRLPVGCSGIRWCARRSWTSWPRKARCSGGPTRPARPASRRGMRCSRACFRPPAGWWVTRPGPSPIRPCPNCSPTPATRPCWSGVTCTRCPRTSLTVTRRRFAARPTSTTMSMTSS